MAVKDNWSREEHILAFNLYSQIPFGTIHVRNPKIQELAKLLDRSTGAVSRKLANFARLDPSLRNGGSRGYHMVLNVRKKSGTNSQSNLRFSLLRAKTCVLSAKAGASKMFHTLKLRTCLHQGKSEKLLCVFE